MKKILLILALVLVWSSNADARKKPRVITPVNPPVVDEVKSVEPCVTYTAEQALDATVEGNNNTFAAVYSTNATRNCDGKHGGKLPDFSDNDRPLPDDDEFGGCGPNFMYCKR